VATLRFYPKALCSFSASGGAAFCLQQRSPAGPPDKLILREFPPLQELTDRTLFIHCLFVAAPTGEPGRFRRKGMATRMVRELIGWATRAGWSAIEATAYEELPSLYAISGVAGRRCRRPRPRRFCPPGGTRTSLSFPVRVYGRRKVGSVRYQMPGRMRLLVLPA
jgi:hypothetical protein